MHILQIIHGYPPNYNAGSEVYTQSICNELSKKHKVSVFTREENPYSPDFVIRHIKATYNLDFYFVNNPQGKDGYRHKQIDLNFADLLRQIKPDVAHIGHLNHLSTGLVDELKKLNIPIIYTLHDFWLMCPRGQFLTRSIGKEDNFRLCSGQKDQKCAENCYKVYFGGQDADKKRETESWRFWVHKRMAETRLIIDKVDLFIAPSRYLLNRFKDDFALPDNKIIYVDYGFPTEYLTPTKTILENKVFTFGYIGTHIPAKGVNHLIEAFSQIREQAVLKIFGRENGQSTNALKERASTSINRIEFAGEYINQNLANEVFTKVDCIVVPSIWAENSPLVIHEAQSCRIPVITADFGGMKEYVQHKINGLLFEHRNINSLKEQLIFAIRNPSLMKQLGERGYLYSPDGNVPNIQDHCRELEKIYNRKIPKKLWRITLDTNPEDCNLNCIMCEEQSPYSKFIPNLYKEDGLKNRRMKIATIESIFQQAEKLGVKEIIPSTMGEPLLFAGIEKIYGLSTEHSIKINLTTNGTFPKLSIEEWSKMILPNTTDVKISWNGATAGTAEKVMQGLNFEKTLENLKRFIILRNEHYSRTGHYCRITFQMTFLQSNVHELNDIIKLAVSIGVDRVKGHHVWAHFEELQTLSMKATTSSIGQWNELVDQAYQVQEEFRKPNGDKVILENLIRLQENEIEEVPDEYECPFLGRELWISASGKISPCCAPDNLRNSLGSFGNINNIAIEDVLLNPEYKKLVSNYKSNQLCKSCNMRKPL